MSLVLVLAVCPAGLSGSWAWGAEEATLTAYFGRRSQNGESREALLAQLRKQAEVIEAQNAIVKTVAKLVGPTVVHVAADTVRQSAIQAGRNTQVEESGSGVIIELGGKFYILTNRHVIRDASREAVKIDLADGRQILPDQIWDDADTDVAVLAVSAPNLVAAEVGNSDRIETGDFVLAVGSPYGLNRSVTFGIISAKGRRELKLGEGGVGVRFQDFLQTDAAINPGNSGGPLINLRGEVIGINTAIASSSGRNEGIGFAIPINMFMNVARQLIEHGVVARAFMGVNLNMRFGPAMAAELGLPRPLGALINGITPDSPAAAAHLEVGDVILEFDHKPVEDDSHLINLVSMTEVGKQVPVVVYRNRQLLNLTIEVADRNKFVSPEPAER
jgi:serine protease Do